MGQAGRVALRYPLDCECGESKRWKNVSLALVHARRGRVEQSQAGGWRAKESDMQQVLILAAW
jgi:hypothetical protein